MRGIEAGAAAHGKPKDCGGWCAREDLNLHPLRDQILSLACLPFHHSRIRPVNMAAFSPNLKPESAADQGSEWFRACFENGPADLAAGRGGGLRCSAVKDFLRICALVAPRHAPRRARNSLVASLCSSSISFRRANARSEVPRHFLTCLPLILNRAKIMPDGA
jgi:hypothetical protein